MAAAAAPGARVSAGAVPASVTVSVLFAAFLGAGDLQSRSRGVAVGRQAAQMWVLPPRAGSCPRCTPSPLPTCPLWGDAGIYPQSDWDGGGLYRPPPNP